MLGFHVIKLYNPMLALQKSHASIMGANKHDTRRVPICCSPKRRTKMQQATATVTSASSVNMTLIQISRVFLQNYVEENLLHKYSNREI